MTQKTSGTHAHVVGEFTLTADETHRVRVTSSWELRHAVIETRSTDGGVVHAFLDDGDVAWLLAALDGEPAHEWRELTESGRARVDENPPEFLELRLERQGRKARVMLRRADVVRLRRALVTARHHWFGRR